MLERADLLGKLLSMAETQRVSIRGKLSKKHIKEVFSGYEKLRGFS